MTKPRAIVVGSGLNALGVVRSLAPENIPIAVLDEASGGPAVHSRHATPHLLPPHPSNDEWIAAILRLAGDDRPALFLTQEATVALCSAERDRIAAKVRHVWAARETLSALLDKRGFHTLAQDLGFPVPQSIVFDQGADFAPAARLAYPCILKPVTKNAIWDRRFKKAYRFDAFEPLAEFAKGLADEPSPVIVQEWIEGGDSDVYFTLIYRAEDGTIPASFTGRKIRQWPPLVGGTASCMPAPEAEAAIAGLTARFFETVKFAGLGSMEYKRDRRTGRYVMVEPTVGRSDYQEEVSTLNGVNVVRAAYRSLANLPPLSPARPQTKVVWRDAAGDENSRARQPDAIDPPEAKGARTADALFRWTDPGPWLADIKTRIAARLGRPRG